MGGRYGSIDDEGISYTEREYDYAVATNKTILAFPHANPPSLPFNKSEISSEQRSRLEEFRNKVMNGRLVKQWNSRAELDALVIKSVARVVSEFPAVGWIRGNTAANEDILNQINSLRIENDRLNDENLRLNLELTPNAVGLANDEDIFDIRFIHSHKWNGSIKRDDIIIKLSWNDIFRSIAQKLDLPRPSNNIGSYISSYIAENFKEKRNISIFETDAVVIKNQLVGLGLIKTEV